MVCTGFSIPLALPGPGSIGYTVALCRPPWHRMKSGGPHSSCSTQPNLSEHISCAHEPARQLSAPIKECEMWLIQSLQWGNQGKRCAGCAASGPLGGLGPCCFPWHPSPSPRWPLRFLHLPSPSFLRPWSCRTVPCPASPSINRPFCPHSVSFEKLMCTELSVADHGLIPSSLRDNWLTYEAPSALMPKARLATDECKNHACFVLIYRPRYSEFCCESFLPLSTKAKVDES